MNVVLEFFSVIFTVLFSYVEPLKFVFANKKSIQSKVVFITGAASGIGKATAEKFTCYKCKLIICDISEKIHDVAKEFQDLGCDVKAYTIDITNYLEYTAIIENVISDYGKIDIFINNAGILHGRGCLDLSEKDIRRTFEVNVLSHFWAYKAVLPSMMSRNNGDIVTVCSTASQLGTAFLTDYCSTKFASYGATEAVQDEMRRLGKTGIKFHIVNPHFIDPRFGILNNGTNTQPLQRFFRYITPSDVADAIVKGIENGTRLIYVPSYMFLLLEVMHSFLPMRALYALKDFAGAGVNPGQ